MPLIDFEKEFDSWRNDGEHESLSDKIGYVDVWDIRMIKEFGISLLTRQMEKDKEEFRKMIPELEELYSVPPLTKRETEQFKNGWKTCGEKMKYLLDRNY